MSEKTQALLPVTRHPTQIKGNCPTCGHSQSHSLPGDVGTVSAVDAFEMGFSFGMSMRGQTLEDSRAVGRLLTSDTFKAIAPQIEKATKEQGFDSFQDADSGMCQAKRIIRAALTPSDQPKCAMCLGDKVVDGETCSRCGGIGFRTSTPAAPPKGEAEKVDPLFEGLAAQVRELISEGDGSWQPCTGCHETEDGQNVHGFPYSPALQSLIGSGCRECGGIGAVWDNTDYEEYASFMVALDRDHANVKRILIEGGVEDYRAGQLATAITTELDASTT